MFLQTCEKKKSRLYVYYFVSKQRVSKSQYQDLELTADIADTIQEIVKKMHASDEPEVQYLEFCANNEDQVLSWYSVGFVTTDPKDHIIITLTEEGPLEKRPSYTDQLTGMYNKNGMSQWIMQRYVNGYDTDKHANDMAMYIDIQRFKMVNDSFGMEEGDRLLKHVADVIRQAVGKSGTGCRIDADRFLLFMSCERERQEEVASEILAKISAFELPFEVACNAGIYRVNGTHLASDAIIDRAVLAYSAIKGSYSKKYCFYSTRLREQMITEQEITGLMNASLKNRQFEVYYQPQYDHKQGSLIGAEALVRWNHPDKGMISPANFIPVFEKNGFIVQLDAYVFEEVCKFIKHCMEEGLPVVPVSVNLTRYDIFSPNFIESLEETRKKYGISPKYLRVEITESAALGNSQFINEAVRKLHQFGYFVEMDDFGSGYSSLNILKDIDFDMIKLDMRFLHKEEGERQRGGIILSSIVRMANWLSLPVIAEGVETIEQADFLKSIGSDYVQGYLYSRPLEKNVYKELLKTAHVGEARAQMKLYERLNASAFWSNDSMETLIFSNFVGGAGIFGYQDGKVEILRVNDKYLSEIGMNLSERELTKMDFLSFFSEAGREEYLAMMERAVQTQDEQECETWRTIQSDCCGTEKICIRSNVRLIGKMGDQYLMYVMIRNITKERKMFSQISDNEKRFKMASEQINIYYWEYDVKTKEMRPCFRCMRDLGLPALVKNYPDSAIEMGIFPPEVADMYRDWHRQIENGVKSLEAVIPLTVGRVPFTVRYTTEFDECGNPIKAYGSAALVV